MSYYKDGQPPSPYWSSSPGQYPFSNNYPTPSYQNNFFPSQQQLPALPGLAYPPPAGMHQHHGFVSHCNNTSPPASFINGNSQLQPALGSQQLPALPGLAQPAPARMHHHHGFISHCNNTSPPASFINGNAQLQPALRSDSNGSSSGKTNLLGSYTTPSSTQQESSFAQVLLPTRRSTRKSSPYFSPPPPLPQVLALAISPNDPTCQEDSTSAIVYRNSPYFSEAPNLDTGSGSSESSTSSTAVTNRPVPAKSAFMCFSEVSGKALFDRTGAGGSKGGFVEVVAAEWRSLSKQDKSYWENMAKKEKTRFTNEKKAYKGPIPLKLRAKKNPLAPKRPMSAFLMYAQQKRRPLQRENPGMTNADISRLLGELWRNTSVVEKRPILEREEVERKIYKAKMEAFKNDEKFVKSMKTLAAAATMTGYAGKKVDQERQDDASFTREESHSNQRYSVHRSCAKYRSILSQEYARPSAPRKLCR